jgi:hypothetical protein
MADMQEGAGAAIFIHRVIEDEAAADSTGTVII